MQSSVRQSSQIHSVQIRETKKLHILESRDVICEFFRIQDSTIAPKDGYQVMWVRGGEAQEAQPTSLLLPYTTIDHHMCYHISTVPNEDLDLIQQLAAPSAGWHRPTDKHREWFAKQMQKIRG